jgi:hypothetical protein
MLEQAQGNYICRWDDDDISLPWRLSYSVAKLFGATPPKGTLRGMSQWRWDPPSGFPTLMEWRPENHWYFPKGGKLQETKHPGNTHIMSIWHRDLILKQNVAYPGRVCPSGYEDQTFNQHLFKLGYPRYGDILPTPYMFYLYRWGTGSLHLSGKGGGERMQQTYRELADTPIVEGTFDLKPRWHTDFVGLVEGELATR